MGENGEALAQNALAKALLGDETAHTGLAQSTVYRWYTDPASRDIYHPDDQERHGRAFTAELRAAYARGGSRSRAGEIVAALQRESPELAAVWAEHEVGEPHMRTKRFRHPDLGDLTLECETLLDTEAQQRLLVFTATPGSESAQKLALLGVIGTERMLAPAD